MILALLGRGFGPLATLVLLAYLAEFPPAYTAHFAVLAAYMQLATAPLNPYAEQFQLRELMKGRQAGYKAGLTGLALLWLFSAILVSVLDQSLWILTIVPLLGLGHLMLKIIAAILRANGQNGVAIVLEFSLRPVTLLISTGIVFISFGSSVQGLEWAFGITGLGTIVAALTVFKSCNAAYEHPKLGRDTSATDNPSAPWGFILLGVLMVMAAQFEVFALDYLASDEELAIYKVALQLASVCGIATNFILMNYLRELYAHNPVSGSYKKIFRKVKYQTLGIALVFTFCFIVIAISYPIIWNRETWILAAVGATIMSISASFGPIGNWLYAAGKVNNIILCIIFVLLLKFLLIAAIYFLGELSSLTLMVVFGVGTLAHNLLMYRAKINSEKATKVHDDA